MGIKQVCSVCTCSDLKFGHMMGVHEVVKCRNCGQRYWGVGGELRITGEGLEEWWIPGDSATARRLYLETNTHVNHAVTSKWVADRRKEVYRGD